MRDKRSAQDRINEMVDVLRTWQGIERQSMVDTAKIQEKTKNPFIRLIMEIIRHDSLMHHRVQQFLIDAVTEKDISLSREELAEVWEQIEAHDRAEQKTIELARGLKDRAWSPLHRQLLEYLLTDESKHDALLQDLEGIKKGMTRASGA